MKKRPNYLTVAMGSQDDPKLVIMGEHQTLPEAVLSAESHNDFVSEEKSPGMSGYDRYIVEVFKRVDYVIKEKE